MAEELSRAIQGASNPGDAATRWAELTRGTLHPKLPAAVHAAAFQEVYRGWNHAAGPPPAWIPPQDISARCNLGRLINRLGFANEADFRAWTVRDRAGFWGEMARTLAIRFDQPPREVLDPSGGPERPNWFPGATLDITRSCFQADPSAIAVRQESETGSRREMTYEQLERLVDRVAGGLAAAGLAPGERVGLLLPMTIEAVAALLGIIRAGCAAVGIAESFATPEIELRLRLGGARLVITQDAITRRGERLPLYSRLGPIHSVPAVVIPTTDAPPALRDGDRLWGDLIGNNAAFPPRSQGPSAHVNILFSSGTTGDPKAIPWTQTTPIKAAADGYLYHDLQPGDVVAWPTSPGWMMGPWLVFATLMNRGTIALYEGHPASEGFCRFVADAGVTMLGVVPSLVASWKAGGGPDRYDWTRIKCFSSTGECSNPADMLYLMSRAGYRPVIEYCGGTEIGGGYITSSPLLPNAPACFNTVAYGLELTIRDPDGLPAGRGEAFLIGPSLGLSTELLNRDHHETYFADAPAGEGGAVPRRHGDQIERLGAGFYRVLGRVDDTMNLGGIKISAVEIERVLSRHEHVREAAAVSTRPDGGPECLVAYVVADRTDRDAGALREQLQALISGRLNPLFRLSEVVLVDSLPRTASNKLMRRLLRAVPNPPATGAPATPTEEPQHGPE